MMEQMIMCTSCISNYYLCDFLKIINKKIEKCDETYNNVYILHVKRYAIRTYNGLEKNVTHNDVYTLYVKKIVFKDL
jgi:hypothetical protein